MTDSALKACEHWTAPEEHCLKVAVPQAQFLRQCPSAGLRHHYSWFQCQLPLSKIDKPRNQTNGIFCLL